MSSFREMKTTINDQECLVDALKSLGYKPQVNQGKVEVRGHYNETRKAEVILKKEDLKQGGDIGFSKDKEGNFAIVCDTYVMKGFDVNKFQGQLTQNFAEKKVMKQALKGGLRFLGRQTITRNGQSITKLQFAR